MYKIGYLLEDKNNKESYQKILNCFNELQYINTKFDLGLNLVLVDDYINEECDLIIYELWGVNWDKIYWHTYFNAARGNPKWLFFDIGEPHHIGLEVWHFIDDEMGCNWEDDRILRTLCNFKHPKRGYSISTYENTPKNFQYPPFIKWGFYNQLKDMYESSQLKKIRDTKKTKFCSMVLSDTTPERYTFFDYIQANYKIIRSFGRTKKNMGNIRYSDAVLNKILPSYKFNVCFENTRSDYNEAYITEKIFNAFSRGTVPIYWGENNYIYDFLNKDSFINLTGLSWAESLKIIKEYDNNDHLYNQMLYANPINTNYNYNEFIDNYEKFLAKVLVE